MLSYPHPTLPGVFVSTPLYIGFGNETAKMQICLHLWPEGMPDTMEDSPDGRSRVGMQKCTLCGASRAIHTSQTPSGEES